MKNVCTHIHVPCTCIYIDICRHVYTCTCTQTLQCTVYTNVHVHVYMYLRCHPIWSANERLSLHQQSLSQLGSDTKVSYSGQGTTSYMYTHSAMHETTHVHDNSPNLTSPLSVNRILAPCTWNHYNMYMYIMYMCMYT